jgi:hypothetical protein
MKAGGVVIAITQRRLGLEEKALANLRYLAGGDDTQTAGHPPSDASAVPDPPEQGPDRQ